jgi:hypothetical protein
MYAFTVIIVPGLVVVYGDVGDAMLRTSYTTVEETVGWLRGAGWDYLSGKLMFREAFRRFYPDDAVDWVRQRMAEGNEHGWSNDRERRAWEEFSADVEDSSACHDLHEHEWHRLVSDMGLDGDGHSVGTGWSASAFWTVECLRTFVALYDAKEP